MYTHNMLAAQEDSVAAEDSISSVGAAETNLRRRLAAEDSWRRGARREDSLAQVSLFVSGALLKRRLFPTWA